jgi:hypothetical protein
MGVTFAQTSWLAAGSPVDFSALASPEIKINHCLIIWKRRQMPFAFNAFTVAPSPLPSPPSRGGFSLLVRIQSPEE